MAAMNASEQLDDHAPAPADAPADTHAASESSVEADAETVAPTPAPDDKHNARVAYRVARRALAPEVRKKANKHLLAKLLHAQAIAQAKTILIYAATPWEVNLDDLIAPLTRAGKRVAFPRMTKIPGVMTLWAVRHVDALLEVEGAQVRSPDITRALPLEPKDVDLVLVPGVAFTRTLGRLGQGGGYYDRLLTRLPPHAKRIGVAFDIQLADSLPIESHDVAMHALVTESAVYGETALLDAVPAPAKPGDTPAMPSEATVEPLAETVDASTDH
jgi:5-formyltetrahydrofolate cyclo-ligase